MVADSQNTWRFGMRTLHSKIGGILLGFAVIFGIAAASSATAQAQYQQYPGQYPNGQYDPYRQDREREREREREDRYRRNRHHDQDNDGDNDDRYRNGGYR